MAELRSKSYRRAHFVPACLVFALVLLLVADPAFAEQTSTPALAVTHDSAAAQVAGVDAGSFMSLSPSRVLDTRVGNGAPAAAGANAAITLQITGRGGVPTTGVGAVVLNVTVTRPTAAGFITVYPAGSGLPDASNLNFSAGQTMPNLVVVPVGADGMVEAVQRLTRHHPSDRRRRRLLPRRRTHRGWRVRPVGVRRGCWTPGSASGRPAAAGANAAITLQVTGRGGVPTTGVGAVVLNVTVTRPTAAGYITVYPAGGALADASNLNFSAGQTVPEPGRRAGRRRRHGRSCSTAHPAPPI